MRLIPVVAILMLAAAPASAQELGERTVSPAQMVAGMTNVSPEEEMRALVAVADAHPLGTLENPIRVGGPEGERAYLGHLRCPDGSALRIGVRSQAGVGAFGSLVSAFEIGCGNATGRLVFDMYHEEHVETRAPAGFSYVP